MSTVMPKGASQLRQSMGVDGAIVFQAKRTAYLEV